MQKVTVTSATGAQGKAIVEAFRGRDFEVIGLSRNPQTSVPGIISLDTSDDDGVARALDGQDVLVFTPPIDHRPGVRQQLAERFARASERAGVGRIVINTAAITPDDFRKAAGDDVRAIQEAFLSRPVPVAVVQPSVYMNNLREDWALGAIRNGVLPYPAPRNARISWLSHRDLGAFTVAAVEHAKEGGTIFRVGGPDVLTAGDVVHILSDVAGRTIQYQEVPLEGFAASLNEMMGPPAGDNIADFYRHLHTSPDALARNEDDARRLGVKAQTFRDWAVQHDWS